MVALKKESELLYDSQLKELLLNLKDGKIEDYEEAAKALNLRAMAALAGKVAKEGIEKFNRSSKLFREFILANTLSEEELQKTKELLKKSTLEKEEKIKIETLLKYYLDDPLWFDSFENAQFLQKDELYYKLAGHRCMDEGDYKKAAEKYHKAFEIAKNDPRYLNYKCEALKALGNQKEVFRELSNITENYEYFVQGWNGLARYYLDQGKLHLAYQAIGKALSINPNDWGAFLALADFYLARGEYGRARGVLEILLSLEPTRYVAAEVFNYLGYLFSLDNRYQEGQSCLERALRMNPNLAEAWYNLGNIVFHQKQLEEALACYERAATSDPKMASAYTQIGLTLLEMGKICNADKPFLKALEIDPSEYFAHLGLSEFYRRAKDSAKALKYAEMAVNIEPSDPNAYNILGIAYEFNKKYKEAEKAYQKALELEPMHRWAANNLGYLYEKLMSSDKKYKNLAIKAWKKRLEICLKTKVSIKGALNHLLKLGVKSGEIKKWMEQIKK
ncbi:MAG: tetratricopeptide repeat protein [Thermoanaerobaculaceae bacterium]|nr:tetratricopeptide repeat protein [Thermoanaerobaculaceae bacterium]